jgi:hypothetical protein
MDKTDEIERRLMQAMLERLCNTPLITENSRGEQLNQTQRVFWAIQFIKDFAADRDIELD